MKRLGSFFLGCMLAIAFICYTFADNSFLSYLDEMIDGSDSFGYDSSDSISILSVSDSTVKLKSTVVSNVFGEDILNYMVLYSTSKGAYEDPSSLLYQKYFTGISASNGFFSLDLDVNNLKINKDNIYYVTILPIDEKFFDGDDSAAGMPSTVIGELCFKVSDKSYGMDDECERHSSSKSVYTLTGVTHDIKGNTITLKWNNSFVTDDVEIYLFNDEDGDFVFLDVVGKNDNTYSFSEKTYRDYADGGDFTVRFLPKDGSIAINYTLHYLTTESPEVKPEVKPTQVQSVVVGPKENIVAILIGTVVLYLLYRIVVKRKA